uniref:Uncharacterized protein n=1 Tax=Anguilla anguilla TaxID=7936 RepID=A0A0E9R8W8_ANGAN
MAEYAAASVEVDSTEGSRAR